MINELKKILEKPVLSSEDKKNVEKWSEELGVNYVWEECKEFHKKQALKIMETIKPQEKTTKNEGLPKLKKGKDFIFMSQRVNEHTITPKIIKQMQAAGLSHFFEDEE